MGYLIAIAVLAGVIASINLVLTLGVIRRLRDHADQLGHLRTVAGLRESPGAILAPGERPRPFNAQTVDGREINERWLAGATSVVAFLAPGCAPCEELLPKFAAAAGPLSREGGRVLAVVAGPPDEAGEYVDALREAANVVVEEDGGPLHQAFDVRGWPAVCRLDETTAVVTRARSEVLGDLVDA